MEKNLPFQIGMQYENWELDLEVVEDKFHLEKYRYLGTDITEINGLKIIEIHLYFNLDILEKIEIKTQLPNKLNTSTLIVK